MLKLSKLRSWMAELRRRKDAAKSPQKPAVSPTGTRRYSVLFYQGGVRDIMANAPVDAAIMAHAAAIKDGFHVTPPGWCNVRDLQTSTVYGVAVGALRTVRISGIPVTYIVLIDRKENCPKCDQPFSPAPVHGDMKRCCGAEFSFHSACLPHAIGNTE